MRKVGTSGSQGTPRARVARLALCALLLGVLLSALLAGPASAFSQRGHEFSASFGTDIALNDPTGVAVNEKTGDVFVVDSGNNRVDVFDPTHHFLAAWGYGVKNGAKELQVCTTGCLKGLPGRKQGQLEFAQGIAVDNSESPSAGDVYVEAVISKEQNEESEAPVGIVDKFELQEGDPTKLPVVKATFTHGKGGKTFKELHGVAVGPHGEFFVANEEEVAAFNAEAENKLLTSIVSELEYEPEPGFALAPGAGPEGGFYLAQRLPGQQSPVVIAKAERVTEEKEARTLSLTEALDTQNSTGVASDYKTEDVYVDHGGTIAAFDQGTNPIQTFGEEGGVKHIAQGGALTVDATNGEVLVADPGGERVDTFTLEEPGNAPRIDELSALGTTATTSTLGALIDPAGSATEYAFRYSPGAVPAGDEPCELPCVQIPVTPESVGGGFGDVPESADVKGLTPATLYHYRVWALNADQPATYVEAESQFKTQNEVSGETLPDSRQWQQVSPPEKTGASINGFPNKGGSGALIKASTDGKGVTYSSIGGIRGTLEGEEEPEGNRAPEVAQILSRRLTGGWASADIDSPHNTAEGFKPGNAPLYHEFSEDLSSALFELYKPESVEQPELSPEATEKTPYVRHNLTCAADKATCFQPLVFPGDVPGGTAFGNHVKYVSSTPDMSHVVVRASGPHLTGEATPTAVNLYEWHEGKLALINTLPEAEKESKSLPVLGWAGEEPANVRGAISKNGARYVWSGNNSINVAQVEHIYLRDMNQPRSVRLDVKNPAIAEAPECQINHSPCEGARFQLANAEDSIIYFTDAQRLTPDSGATKEEPDLYACNVKEGEVEEEGVTRKEVAGCNLTDLTPAVGGVAGHPVGLVMGASEDGHVVYFAADGPLAGQQPGTCVLGQAERAKAGAITEATPLATECTVFMARYDAAGETWGAPEPVQRLSSEDEFDWTPPSARQQNAAEMTSEVSPNGEWLAFMSDRNLTGYDTRRLGNNRPVEEVYLYNSRTGKTVCSSCDPTGARPTGIFDTQEAAEGIGLAVDRPLLWNERWLSANVPSGNKLSLGLALYQPRYVTDAGRVFFDSAEGLVPQDTNGKEDAYEYEPAEVGGCTTGSETYVETVFDTGCVSVVSSGKSSKESVFLDSSLTGEDVFFLTSQTLTASDIDTGNDVYDASICGVDGREACLPAPAGQEKPCEGSAECRPGATGSPVFGPTGSELPSSGGNVSPQHEVLASTETKPPVNKITTTKKPTRAQLLARALKSCHKLKKHNKRVACEKSARKRYGAKKASRSAHKTTRSGR